MTLSEYIEHLEKRGESYFTTDDALEALSVEQKTFYAKVHRLKRKGILVSPLQGLYIILPSKYRAFGSLPAQELVVIIMKHKKALYYAGLLTAAAYHGATHQKLRVFQAVCNKRIRHDVVLGDVWIQFIYKRNIEEVKTQNKAVRTGYLPISSPEETAKDIMMYHEKCGGINHQATVLSELVEALDPKEMVNLIKRSKKIFWAQRMGYILETVDTFYEKERSKILKALERCFKRRKLYYAPLTPEVTTFQKRRNKKWHIIENTTVDSDI